jgi:hypothetical protein
LVIAQARVRLLPEQLAGSIGRAGTHAASTGDLRKPQRGRSVPIIAKGISKEEEAALAQAERDKAKLGSIVSAATVGSAIKGKRTNRSASIVHTNPRRMSMMRRGSRFWAGAGLPESKSESRLKYVWARASERAPDAPDAPLACARAARRFSRL